MSSSPDDLPTRITLGAQLPVRRTSSRNRACLIQYNGARLGQRYLLDMPEITIGRQAANDFTIDDDSVSRTHARITSSGSTVTIEDLRSSNGTFVQNKPVKSRATIADGDILRVGNILLKFFANDNIENVFHDKIYRMATIDAGTKLFNKTYLLETLDSEFRYCRIHKRPLSVIYYDLDFFKRVNDTHGHICGDYILSESAQIVKTCMRKEDILARYGGEEFVAVLPGAEVGIAGELAERIRKSVECYDFEFEGKRLEQTISMGVSELHPSFKSSLDLLKDADRKLYLSKNSGRNQVTV